MLANDLGKARQNEFADFRAYCGVESVRIAGV
jgi:hypothetical protein